MTRDSCVATCQFEPTIGDRDINYQQIESILSSLPTEVDLAVFPELCVSGYDLNAAMEVATPIPGTVTDPLVKMASEQDVTIVVGVPERDEDTLYNTLVYIDQEGVQAIYRKQYLWGDESGGFGKGTGPVTLETEFGKLGFLLCYDLNFPEAALAYGQANCDLLVVSAAWRESYLDNWKILLQSRALDGTSYVVGSNHCGNQRGRRHGGHSLIADPCGEIVESAGTHTSNAIATLERTRLQKCRQRNPVAAYREHTQSPNST